MQLNQRKLKNLIINPKFQMKYIFWLSSTAFVLIALFIFIFYTFNQENYEIFVGLMDMTPETKSQLDFELKQIVTLMSIAGLFFIIAVTLIGLFFSHRVAGPLYKIEKVMKAIADGNTDARVFFRPEDEFQSLSKTFNEMMDRVLKK